MKKWYEVIRDAWAIYLHRDDYCYFYGAKGQVLTDRLMDALISAEPKYWSKYTQADIVKIKNFSRGKIGLDCSGFITRITGNATSSYYQYKGCTNKSTDIKHGVAGSIVYSTFYGTGSHIGIDVGFGYYLHFPKELHSCELGRFNENTTVWEHTGRMTDYIDYGPVPTDQENVPAYWV